MTASTSLPTNTTGMVEVGMFTSQLGGPSDRPEDTYARIMRAIDFARILWVLANRGAEGLSEAQRVSISEIHRLSGAHPDPRVRSMLEGSLNKVRAVHLERCLKQS
jgi:hypothetical protein